MTTHPFIPLYVDDYEAATAHLSIEEDGLYSRLLRLCWRTPGCSLPNDPTWIARKVRLSAADFERVARPVLDEFFTIQRGRFVQRRLKAEYDDITRKKTARKNAGKKGGDAKAQKSKDNPASNATDLPADMRAFPEPEPYPDKRETDVSSVGPSGPTGLLLFGEDPKPEAGSKAKAWEASVPFEVFWSAAGGSMRTRSAKAKAWPVWKATSERVGVEALLAALRRYLAEDADVQRTGGPGLHIWLKDAKWEHWLPRGATGAAAAASGRFVEPAVRAEVATQLGEDFALKWLDPCGWQEIPERVITAPNKFIADKLLKEKSVFRSLGIHSVRIHAEKAA